MRRTLFLLSLILTPGAALAQTAPFVEDLTSVLVQGAERSIAALWNDYDLDGDLDLLVTDVEGDRLDDLYRNEGGGTFTYLQVPTNEDPRAVTNSGTFADFDNDGDLDFLGTSLNDGSLYLNRGSTGGVPSFNYRWTRLDFVEDVRDGAAADFDGDGRLDVVLVRRFNFPNLLIRNEGDRGMSLIGGDVYEDADDSLSLCWGDVDNDGDPDLVITNDGSANRYYVNDGFDLVRDTAQPFLSLEGNTVGCAWGDYDADGDLDLALSLVDTATQPRTQLFRNDAGSFAAVPIESRLLDSVGLGWGDVDSDGDLDLVVAHRGGQGHTVYSNDGAGTFTALDFGVSATYTVALTLVDDDEDGDLDAFISNGGYNFVERNQLYRNTTDGAGNWLAVDLRRETGSNRFGVGAHVYAYATVGGVPRVMLRPIHAHSGWLAESGYRVHFGLGDASVVDSLVVDWPRGVGEDRTVLYDVAVNQLLAVGGASGTAGALAASAAGEAPASFAVEGARPNPSHRYVTLTVRSGSEETVRVDVLDVLGRRVRVLEAEGAAGTSVRLHWDGTDAQGRPAAAGLYVLRVRQGADEDVVKVTLLH